MACVCVSTCEHVCTLCKCMFRWVYACSAVLFSHPFLSFILYLAFCLTNVPHYIIYYAFCLTNVPNVILSPTVCRDSTSPLTTHVYYYNILPSLGANDIIKLQVKGKVL